MGARRAAEPSACEDSVGKQIAHSRVFRARQFEEALQYRHHQGMALLEGDRAQGLVHARAAGQAERPPALSITLEGRQPQIVVMLKHCQALAAMQLHGELGRQRMEARLGFQAVDDPGSQRARVDDPFAVDAGSGAEHDIAHVVAGCVPWTQASLQQMLDQGLMTFTDTPYLQIAAVGRLDRSPGIPLGGFGDGLGLVRTQFAAGEFDTADPPVQCLHDTQQPRTRRGADNVRSLVQRGTGHARKTTGMGKARYYACFGRRHEKSARRNSFV